MCVLVRDVYGQGSAPGRASDEGGVTCVDYVLFCWITRPGDGFVFRVPCTRGATGSRGRRATSEMMAPNHGHVDVGALGIASEPLVARSQVGCRRDGESSDSSWRDADAGAKGLVAVAAQRALAGKNRDGGEADL